LPVVDRISIDDARIEDVRPLPIRSGRRICARRFRPSFAEPIAPARAAQKPLKKYPSPVRAACRCRANHESRIGIPPPF
jgi:hypothetical protein